MTDAASLLITIDSRQVKAGQFDLEQLAAAGARAEASVGKMGRATATAGTQVQTASQAAAQMAAELQRTGASATRQRAGLQQLGQQVGDVASQYSTGSASVETFAYQVLQATQAVGLMRAQSTGLVSFFGGPWGIAIAGAASLVGTLVSGLFNSADASDVAAKRAKNYTDALGEQLGALEKVIRSELRLAAIRSTNMAAAARTAQSAVEQAQKEVAAARLLRDNTSRGAAALVFPDSLPSSTEARARVDLEQRTIALTAAEKELTKTQRIARVAQLDLVQATAALTPEQVRLQRQIDKLRQSVTLNEGAWKKGVPEIVRLQREYNALGQKTDEAAGKTRTAAGAHTAHASAARESAAAMREAAAAERELASALDSVQRQFDPAAALARSFASTMADIDQLRLAGLIGAGQALTYQLAAAVQQASKLTEIVTPLGKVLESLRKDAGFDPGKSLADQLGIDARGDAGADGALAMQDEFLRGLDDMVARSEDAATAMANAFGRAGDGIGDLIVAMADYKKASAIVHDQTVKFGAADMMSTEALKRAETARNGALISGVKSLFKEHSTAYQAMAAAEKAYAVLTLINTAKSVAAGAAKMFSQLGAFAFPAVGAMIAVMAGLGFGGGGGSSGGAPSAEDLQAKQGTGTVLGDPSAQSSSIANSLDLLARNSSKDLEFGNQMVRSLRSIDNNIGALASALARQLNMAGGSFDTAGLGLGSKTKGPLDSLMGAAVLGPIGLITGNLITKIPVIGDILKGISKVIFNVKTTVSLLDQGIEFNASAIDEILRSGVDGFSYQTLEIKKKKKLLGIGVGGSTKTSTVTGALDGEVERQIGLIIGDLYTTVVEAAKIIGLDVGDALRTFQVEIGKISLKDLKGDEIAAALQSVFSKVADEMAGFAVAGVEQFQKAGEGLFETLTRLAKDYLTLDATLASAGLSFGAVGASSIGAREALVDLSGGLDQFVDSISYYQQNFLTDAERQSILQAAVTAEMQRLGTSSITTVEQFKAVVRGIDLTTSAGQDLFTSLMAVAPAFYQVATAVDAAATAADAAAKAQAQAKTQLNIQLLQALGQSEAALTMQRSLELRALDASLRPLQMQVWAAQDASKAMEDVARTTQAAAQAASQAAEKAAQEASRIEADAIQRVDQAKNDLLGTYRRERGELDETASRFRSFGDDLRAFRDSLFATGTGAASRSQALVSLMKVGGLAGAGNEQALGQLPGTAREFLDISRGSASSLLQYQRDVALVANYVGAGIKAADKQVSNAERQMIALESQVGRLVDLNEGVLTVRQAIDQLQQAQSSQASASEAAARARDEAAAKDRAAMLAEAKKLVITNEAIAFSNAAVAKALTGAIQGDAITVRGDADTPVYTSAV